jgi:predicted HicB family RNase H-like nuclease
MPGPINNKNAAKPADQRAESFLHIRCRREDKARWVKAAQRERLTLSQYVHRCLTPPSPSA